MTNLQRSITAVLGLALVGTYSWIMVGSSGAAASWAWVLLAGAFVSLAVAARGTAGRQTDDASKV